MRTKIIYLISLILLSLSCKEEQETLQIRSLSYANNNVTLKVGEGFVSDNPEVDADGSITFSFGDVSASDFEGITIDKSTGVISVEEGNTLTGAITYVIDVAVSNEDFTEVFQSAFVIEMIALDPPKNLTYEPDSISVALATDSSSVIPTVDGLTPLSFRFQNNQELPEFLTINEETGVISIDGGISEAGNYNINLLVANEDGETNFENAYTVKILSPKAVPDFTFAVNGNDPYAIDFTNTSQNAVSYEWDFGDGSGVSTEENPTHAFDAEGTYQVTLSATNIDGFTNSVSKEIIIEVSEPTESILQIISSSPNHTQLEEFINADPELITALGGNDLTLFAPDDDAFENLRAILGVDNLNQINPDILQAVLSYHIVNSVNLRTSFTESTELETLQGESITFNANGNIETGGTNTNVQFDGEEILATNGVVHVVETILIPPTIFASIGANLGKVSQTVFLGANFSTLAAAINKADTEYAATTDGVTPLSSILAGTAGPDQITVFAPVNQVFEASAITLDTYTAQQWYGIIANHVIGQKLLSTDLVIGVGYETLAGGAITLLPSGGLDSDNVAGAEATFIDEAIDIESENGVVHAIAGVLVPASSGRYAIDARYNFE